MAPSRPPAQKPQDFFRSERMRLLENKAKRGERWTDEECDWFLKEMGALIKETGSFLEENRWRIDKVRH
jgi:hypothetical protein